MQQQNFSSQQQYQQPPQVLSTKDSLYLTDMMSWNLLAAKKAHFYAAQCKDPQVIELINRCGQMHQRHYETVLANVHTSQSNTQQFQ